MTKKDENKIYEKEVYRLWWEYLKRSDKYKSYCEYLPRAVEKIKKKKITYGDINKLFISAHSKKYADVVEQSFYTDWMAENYDFFGDVFKNSFDNWWDKRDIFRNKLSIIVLNDPKACKILLSFAQDIRNRQKNKNKLPSPEKTLKILTESEKKYIFLALPMVGDMIVHDISKEIADIRKKWAEEFDIEDYHFRRFSMPVSRVRFDELKRYLRVYDYHKEGLKMKEIIAKIDPNRSADNANVLRSFYMDLKKAKRVIKNVEFGSFPELPLAGREYQLIKNIQFDALLNLPTDK